MISEVYNEDDFFFDPAVPPNPIYENEDLMRTNIRMLRPEDKNYYHVTKTDFQSPNLYQLNFIKPNNRSKVKTFLPMFKHQNLTDNMDKVDKFATFSQEANRTTISNPQAV